MHIEYLKSAKKQKNRGQLILETRVLIYEHFFDGFSIIEDKKYRIGKPRFLYTDILVNLQGILFQIFPNNNS